MVGAQSREGLYLSDSDDYSDDYSDEEDTDRRRENSQEDDDHTSDEQNTPSSTSIDDVESRLKALKNKTPPRAIFKNPVKLYLHIGGISPNAKWVVSEKVTGYSFVKSKGDGTEDEEEDDEFDEDDEEEGVWGGDWELRVGGKIRVRVSSDLRLKMFEDQRRVDFVSDGVWALKFFDDESYRRFVMDFKGCLFENVHGVDEYVLTF